jgi:rRNA-processing protein FCF1
MAKIIFDTNALRNNKLDSYLGNMGELQKFAEECEIIVPEIVIEEIRFQKKRYFLQEKEALTKNSLFRALYKDNDLLNTFDCHTHIATLQNRENIPFKVIKLTYTEAVFDDIKRRSLEKLPPFEPPPSDNKNGSDKGFKDACIFHTVLQYRDKVREKIFVVTQDALLKEALKTEHDIICIKDFQEFREHSISKYSNDYILQKIKEELDLTNISKSNLLEFFKNINENDILEIEVENVRYLVEFDNNEIVDNCEYEELESKVSNLVNSYSYANTHSAVYELEKVKNFLSLEQIKSIFEAFRDNSQVIGDDDVVDFMSSLYEYCGHLIESNLKSCLEKSLNA